MAIFKTFLKDLFFWSQRGKIGQGASILGYHNISNDKAFFTLSAENFEKQLEYIDKNNLTVVLLSELVEKLKAGTDVNDHVVITFHDGYKNNYKNALPILKKFKVKATFFVVPELLDSVIVTSEGFEFDTLSVEEILEMQNSGMEVMSQTGHRQALHDVVLENAAQMIELARKDIEGIIGKKASIFAYPYGRYTEALKKYLEDNGWNGALTMEPGLVRNNADLFSLPRNSITSKTSFVQFKGMLTPAIEKYTALKKR